MALAPPIPDNVDWIEWSGAPAGEIFEHKLQIAEAADKAGFCVVVYRAQRPISAFVVPTTATIQTIEKRRNLCEP